MKLVDIIPKNISIIFELDEDELELLLDALDGAILPENKPEATGFIDKIFFPMLQKLSDDLHKKRT